MYLIHGRLSLLLTAAENWLPIRPNYQSDVLKDRNAAHTAAIFLTFLSVLSTSMCVCVCQDHFLFDPPTLD